MVNISSGEQESRKGMTMQIGRNSEVGQEATTRSVMCAICKALYTPASAHRQLALAPHIVLESAFMSMCHFCFRCRRAACPDCWDAIHGVCGACVEEVGLPFRTGVKPLRHAMLPLEQEQHERNSMEKRGSADVLVCIQHGKFYRGPTQAQTPSSAYSRRLSRPTAVVTRNMKCNGGDERLQGATYHYRPNSVVDGTRRKVKMGGCPQGATPLQLREGGRPQGATPHQLREDGRPQGAPPLHHPTPVPTMSASSPGDRHSRDGGGEDGRGGPLGASVLFNHRDEGKSTTGRASASFNHGDKERAVLNTGWVAEALRAIEQWTTGALLVLLLTIVTMIVIAEASPSANAQIMQVFQIDIRSEVAYLIHLIGQLHW